MKQKIGTLTLSAILVSQTVACGGSGASKDSLSTSGSDSSTTLEAIESGYSYPDEDYGGYEFRVLNFDEYMGFHISLDFEEQTGENLNDAIYNRNRKVEGELNFVLKEIVHPFNNLWPSDQKELIDLVRKSVLTDEDSYDAAYLNLGFNPDIISEGALLDLNQIESLNLDAEWWDSIINDSVEINGKLYGASSPLHLISSEHAWCLLFNEDMMTDLELDFPYQLVRDGKWTIDKMNEYVTAAARLNGDDSFTWKDDGNSIYGLTAHQGSSPRSFLYSAGNRDVSYENGSYELTLGDEHYFNTIEQLTALFNREEGHSHCDTSQTVKSYEQVFKNGRAMFISAQLFMCVYQRSMEATFGLLPNPKYDEEQESYQTLVDGNTALLCVPITNRDPERTGVILDALSYESMVSVLPEFFDNTVSQKGLRNEDSIEMLELIRETRGFDIAWMYQLTSQITSAVSSMIVNGNGEPASTIAENREAVEAKIEATFEAFAE